MPDVLPVAPSPKIFGYYMVVAHQAITSEMVPEWFREHFGDGRFIKRQYAISPKIPLILALTLDLSCETDTPKQRRAAAAARASRDYDPKHFRRKLLPRTMSRLRAARAQLLELQRSIFNPLVSEYVGHRETPDGSIEFEHGPDPINEFVKVIDTLLMRLDALKIGSKTAFVVEAVRRLDNFVEREKPALTLTQREDLCSTLFDEVRRRHEHRSRSPNRDRDDLPRYRDVLERLRTSRVTAQNRPKKSPNLR